MATKPNLPLWARQILKLRQRLGLSQTALGSRLHYSAMAISRWERGAKEPTANCYIQLGNLAGEPDCWTFWSRAGLKSSDLARMFPQDAARTAQFPNFDVVMAGSGVRTAKASPKLSLVAIPVLPIHAATRGEIGDSQTDLRQVAADEILAAPAMWCPHPEQTTCLRVKGSSMSPMVYDGDIVAVDSAQSDSRELNNKIIVAWHREHGLALSRLRLVNGVELLESENSDYEPIMVSKNRDWRIIGKVLWWIRKAP